MSLRARAWHLVSVVCVAACLSAWAVPGLAAADHLATPSPGPVAPIPPAPPAGQPAQPDPPAGPRLSHEVYGYLPYWEMTSATERYLRYDLLTTIALFGVPVRPNGTIGLETAGGEAIVSARAKRIIANAHAAGVRVEIAFTAFGLERNAVFFRNGAHLRQFVKRAVRLMQATGADGINLDVELLDSRYYRPYGVLVRWLKEAATTVDPGATVSVATNANVSGARMARIAAENGADRLFMMGYDYRWAGSDRAGAVDPIVSSRKGLSLTRSIALYAKDRVPLDRVILGLSNYGRSWPTVSSSFNARVRTDARYGGSGVFLPRYLDRLPHDTTSAYDRREQAIMARYWDADLHTWIQIYYNDPRTLAPKLDLADHRQLAGIGIWALGYDRGQPGYWDAIEDVYVVPADQESPGTGGPASGTAGSTPAHALASQSPAPGASASVPGVKPGATGPSDDPAATAVRALPRSWRLGAWSGAR